ncbi:type IV toxin-antitoxin system AbiEi family antitoxin domain-containing protein [Actimicrobium antarcticum]|uniref:Type IV toxin-antitoxin system AbiEi family antitoxin domain-containing protein n=1 Tax=Actimicrobium antarcticum TaxID=1051899 RepID=A0ABP7T2G7_9BURK
MLKPLLQRLPHGRPFGLPELAEHGISPVLAAKYARSGWLVRLEHGTYGYPNDALQLDECLLYLQKRSPGLHVGGKAALSWQGIRHNMSSRSTIHLWGTRRFKLPEWFFSRFPVRYHQRDLFDLKQLQSLLPDEGMVRLADHADGVCVSGRERALIEVLNEVGVTQDIEEATHLFESFTSMRLDVVGALLTASTRIKTVRLFLQLAEQSNAIDVIALRERFTLKLGSNARWTRRLQDGSLLTIK